MFLQDQGKIEVSNLQNLLPRIAFHLFQGIQNSNHLDFTSKRKQMSVTIQHETGQILRLLVLFVKFINVA
ncbi:hypothetical protein H5410_045472 [Solanum commersonii]|uniref:Uncharacterized protein n=1 Tax=Solanum commersonii TaxID=4109 RepID=A0A9J5XCT1_SOLCO|nr:hypothetical protein H5410_045472 [Solanum commersonii]